MSTNTPTLAITDARMLQLMDHCVANRVGGFKRRTAWLEAVGNMMANLSNIRAGKQSFTVHQLQRAAELFNVNLNWLFGVESNMFRSQVGTTALERMRATMVELEAEEQARKTSAGPVLIKASRKRALATVPGSGRKAAK